MFNVIRIRSVVNQPSCQNCLIDQLTFSRFFVVNRCHISFHRPTFKKILNALMSTDRRQTLQTVCWWIDNFSIDYSTTVSVQKKITWPDRHKIGRPTKKEVDICQDNSWRTADCCPNNSKKLKKRPKNRHLSSFGDKAASTIFSNLNSSSLFDCHFLTICIWTICI